MVDKEQPFGPLLPEWYNGELLELAHELGIRLLTAFEHSAEGIPHPRVSIDKDKYKNIYSYMNVLMVSAVLTNTMCIYIVDVCRLTCVWGYLLMAPTTRAQLVLDH